MDLLSENADFAKKCMEEGLVFIGPSPNIIGSMGSKIEARKTMKEAGVPIIEGIDTSLNNEEEAQLAGREIGYPLMLKASAGGGGIGMQLVNSEEELLKAFAGNKKRAESFFGDGAMFLEKYIAEPHHIEVQILADTHGNVIPLWERECSIQRRNQKVVEEAPSPFISEETRKKMLDAAVKAAQAYWIFQCRYHRIFSRQRAKLLFFRNEYEIASRASSYRRDYWPRSCRRTIKSSCR